MNKKQKRCLYLQVLKDKKLNMRQNCFHTLYRRQFHDVECLANLILKIGWNAQSFLKMYVVNYYKLSIIFIFWLYFRSMTGLIVLM